MVRMDTTSAARARAGEIISLSTANAVFTEGKMSEVRDGYTDPANATTQAEKYGAWVRQQEEARAQERAKPVSVPPAPEIFKTDYVDPISRTQHAPSAVPHAPSTAGRTAWAGACIFAVIALVWGYAPQLSASQLGIYLALGAILGYVAMWLDGCSTGRL